MKNSIRPGKRAALAAAILAVALSFQGCLNCFPINSTAPFAVKVRFLRIADCAQIQALRQALDRYAIKNGSFIKYNGIQIWPLDNFDCALLNQKMHMLNGTNHTQMANFPSTVAMKAFFAQVDKSLHGEDSSRPASRRP